MMKISALLLAFALSAGATGATQAQTTDHVVMRPDDIKWNPAPPFLPPGVQVAVLYGDPMKPGEFAMRLKMPAGYHIPPHTHPKLEVVTVVSGTARLGMGRTADKGKTQVLPHESFFALPPGMEHYAYADGETVVQINGVGPWGITYVNPKDDPRNK